MMWSFMRNTKLSLTDIKRYGFKYFLLESDHPENKEGSFAWSKLKFVYANKGKVYVENQIDLLDFEKMLKEATEEELIEFVTTAKLVFIDDRAKEMYGERGEKYFAAVIPKFYKKYKLLFA